MAYVVEALSPSGNRGKAQSLDDFDFRENPMSYRVKMALTLGVLILIPVVVLVFRLESAKRFGGALQSRPSKIAEPAKSVKGWIGVQVEDSATQHSGNSDSKKKEGVVVAEVEPDGPASKAGVKPGDFILEYNKKPTKTPNDLSNAVEGSESGTPARLGIIRDGQGLTLVVVVGKFPSLPSPSSSPIETGNRKRLGMIVEDISQEMKALMDLPAGGGVLVVEVIPGSPADYGGAEPGDIIREINDLQINKASDLLAAIHELEDSRTIVLGLEREGKFLRLAVDW
jgi:serine protease Do